MLQTSALLKNQSAYSFLAMKMKMLKINNLLQIHYYRVSEQ